MLETFKRNLKAPQPTIFSTISKSSGFFAKMHLLSGVLFLVAVFQGCKTDCGSSTSCWDDDLRLAKLEALVEHLQRQVSDLTAAKVETEAELKITQDMAKTAVAGCSNKWTLKRTEIVFPNLEKLALHQQTPTYIETMPTPLPNNTRAVIVQVFCNFWNSDGHAYLNVDIHQEGNEDGGVASVENTHYRVYANTFYYEVMVPWNGDLPDKLKFEVKRSYQTGGDRNWYRLRVVGYILA